MKSTLNSIVVFALAVVLGSASPAHADTLDDIVANGKLVAGIKTDYPPWGMRDNDGQIVGSECGELVAQEGFRQIVEITSGTFDFEKSVSHPVTIEAAGNTNLILDSLRQMDEEAVSDERDL